MKTILNIFRWVLGIAIMLIAINLVETGIFYLFEFVAIKLNGLKGFYYFVIWSIIGLPLILILIQLFTMILKGITLIVKQDVLFARISGIIMFIVYFGTLILFWTNIIEFSWEQLNHLKLNKFIFSLIFISMLSIPFGISTKYKEQI